MTAVLKYARNAELGRTLEPNFSGDNKRANEPKELQISKIDLDYAYGQTKLSDETSRQCVFVINGDNFNGYHRFKKELYGLADIPKIFQEKIDRTLDYCTSAWLPNVIVVTRGDRKEHEKNMLDVLRKLEKAGYRASEIKSKFFQNKIKCWDTRQTRTR